MLVTAKSVNGIDLLQNSECSGAQPMRLFLRPKSMAGLFRALRRAALVGGKVNLFKPAAKLIDLIRGSSQIHNEDADMPSKPKRTHNPRKFQITQNITALNPKRTRESKSHKWEKELIEFLMPLPSHEVELMNRMLEIIMRRPPERTGHCEIIKFAKENQS